MGGMYLIAVFMGLDQAIDMGGDGDGVYLKDAIRIGFKDSEAHRDTGAGGIGG